MKAQYLNEIEEGLKRVIRADAQPEGLYAPIRYALEMGGKRLRPHLVMECYEMVQGTPPLPFVLQAACATEVFHNFTLLHDDLMDDAPLRRGLPTVYAMYDSNTAILSGDAMLIAAYRMLEEIPVALLPTLLKEFNSMALGVCEGQQYDMDFESRTDVTLDEYLEMIHYKTSCLIASSMKMGAMLAGADEALQQCIYEVGDNLGLAFQLMDDYLDVWGTDTFGKRIGGDIIEGKKTWLLIRAFEEAAERQDERLTTALLIRDDDEKVRQVKALYEEYGLRDQARDVMRSYSDKAEAILAGINLPEVRKQPLASLIRKLNERIL